MSEAFLINLIGDRCEAHSAGIKPGERNGFNYGFDNRCVCCRTYLEYTTKTTSEKLVKIFLDSIVYFNAYICI